MLSEAGVCYFSNFLPEIELEHFFFFNWGTFYTKYQKISRDTCCSSNDFAHSSSVAIASLKKVLSVQTGWCWVARTLYIVAKQLGGLLVAVQVVQSLALIHHIFIPYCYQLSTGSGCQWEQVDVVAYKVCHLGLSRVVRAGSACSLWSFLHVCKSLLLKPLLPPGFSWRIRVVPDHVAEPD